MKVNIFDLKGKPVGKIELPRIFKEVVRPDLIKRAFLAIQSHKRQPYGTDPYAGLRTSAHYHGARRKRYTMMNRELARMPRLHGHTVPWLYLEARFVPQARKGRRAHPPRVDKKIREFINRKEKRLALMSAIAATASKFFIEKRGHAIDSLKELPVIVTNEFEDLRKTKEVREFFKKIGIPVDEKGYAIVKPDMSTDIKGIYVVGDSAGGPYKYRFEQIITAAAEGAKAVDSAFKYILGIKSR